MRRLPPERSRSSRRTAFAFIALIATSLAAIEAPSLKSLAPPGLRIGAALNQAQIDGTDAASLAIVKHHFNSITSENILKWAIVHPEPTRYDFAESDRFVSLGQAHDMAKAARKQVRGLLRAV